MKKAAEVLPLSELPAGAGLRILVVDDEPDTCGYLEDFLTREGYSVTCLLDPYKVEDEVRQSAYHIIILDLMMPALSGLNVLTRIRAIDSDVAIIICTAFPSVETATESITHDISAYLEKPFAMEKFRRVLASIAKKKGIALRREDDLHKTIGHNIRELRKKRNLTLKQVARRTALSVSLLSQIERAESSASVSSLFKVATALDVKLTELFGEY